jgi:hypothetical protein
MWIEVVFEGWSVAKQNAWVQALALADAQIIVRPLKASIAIYGGGLRDPFRPDSQCTSGAK